MRAGARLCWFRRFWGHLSPKGMYEYVTVRTRYVDDVFRADAAKVRQVVILGVGYDSRAIRFADELAAARVFEVDAPKPQADKLLGIRLRKLSIPPNLTFVPVDFETQSAAECRADAGFEKDLPTLYLLEGLTMYLTPEAIDETFRFIADSAGSGSILVFDHAYASILRGDEGPYGAK